MSASWSEKGREMDVDEFIHMVRKADWRQKVRDLAIIVGVQAAVERAVEEAQR